MKKFIFLFSIATLLCSCQWEEESDYGNEINIVGSAELPEFGGRFKNKKGSRREKGIVSEQFSSVFGRKSEVTISGEESNYGTTTESMPGADESFRTNASVPYEERL